jgi:hypothetical protein
MNKKNMTYVAIAVAGVVLMGIGGYFVMNNKPFTKIPTIDQTQATQSETSILYNNTKYSFDFSLPISWKGYSIIEDKWIGKMIDAREEPELLAQIEGPKITIRHPLWIKEIQRQDIPIMVFNLTQWNLIQQEKLSVGAAPIGPSELGRNKDYVFALPARYNFAYPVGFEEVDQIIAGKPLQTF